MMCFEFFCQVYLSGGGSRCFGRTLLVTVSPSNLHVYLNILSQTFVTHSQYLSNQSVELYLHNRGR